MRRSLLTALASMGLLFAGAGMAADPIEGLARTCNNCHGMGGVSAGLSMPSIGGLNEHYLEQIMLQWKRDERASGTMGRLIKGYSDEEIVALAKYFSKLSWTPVNQPMSDRVVRHGGDVTERCEPCHGPSGSQPDDALTPVINGQWARYMELELMKYRDDGFTMPHKKMRGNALRLDAADLPTAAQHYSGQNR